MKALALSSAIVLLLLPTMTAFGQTDLVYQIPPEEIAALADAPKTPSVLLSPTGEHMVLRLRRGLPGIDVVSQPELRLGGLRINPRTNGPSRGWYYRGLKFLQVADGRERDVTGLPPDPKISYVSWSPDGKWIAFTITNGGQVELWAADLNTGQARKRTYRALNAAIGRPYEWVSDSRTIVAKTIPSSRGEAPPEPTVPSGPAIQENIGGRRPARTYQDMLKNPYDERLFEHCLSTRIVRIGLDGKEQPVGQQGMIWSVTPSPDGKYILVETFRRPFSYSVPYYRFPRRIEVWDADGNVVKQLADLPLADNVPIAFSSVPTGPRAVDWRQDADATLYWAEALDGGDAGSEADERDRICMLEAPFEGEPVPLVTFGLRFHELRWSDDELALTSEWWWATRRLRVWAVEPGAPEKAPRLMMDYSYEDRYSDPGKPMMMSVDNGASLMVTANDGKTIFLRGDGASPEGDRPFLDEFDIETKETNRLFRSEAPCYERAVSILDVTEREILTRRESVSEVPNYYVRTLGNDSLRRVTRFSHPTPQLLDVQKEMIRYERADGVALTGTLYLPAGYSAETDGPLPMLMWAYPHEFKSAAAAGQVTGSPYRFVRISTHSPLYWLVHGYAVLDNPSLPIVGEGNVEPNDTHVEQLVAGAQAAVDEVVKRGVADRDRTAIGGHSYGAFMTANLLAHSDLFAAGIARSGAYNRTLTPFGFQREERTFWEAPGAYFAMSPFLHADKINEPLLLIHGEMDNSSGTLPIQSERLYGALKGHGATVRLVMLPHESHGYRGRESVMHMLWEMTEWLDRYVANAKPGMKTKGATESLGQ